MAFLFGHLYDRPCKFTHDQAMFRLKGSSTPAVADSRPASPPARPREDGSTLSSRVEDMLSSPDGGADPPSELQSELSEQQARSLGLGPTRLSSPRLPEISIPDSTSSEPRDQPSRKRRRQSSHLEPTPYRPSDPSSGQSGRVDAEPIGLPASDGSGNAPSLSPSEYTSAWQREAFDAALGAGSMDWNQITLTSVTGHQEREEEL